jgi:hypothetical protein
MRAIKPISILMLILTLVGGMLPSSFIHSVYSASQQQIGALERGYRAGYSDGYRTGYRDSLDRLPNDYGSKEDYKRADFGYAASYGSLEDYRDGYQQGFEAGYETGYKLLSFDSSVPDNLTRRGVAGVARDNSSDENQSSAQDNSITIPADLEMRVEMLTNISTNVNQRGDTFQVRVLDPQEYEGAIIEGHILRVKRAGRIRGTSELQVTFDRIKLKDNREAKFNAQLTEIVETETGKGGKVDVEGGIAGESSKKEDVAKIGAGAGIGAVIGAIAGGGTGAAVGAIIGGVVGTGGVLATRGKEISLPRGQQVVIRTSNETIIE